MASANLRGKGLATAALAALVLAACSSTPAVVDQIAATDLPLVAATTQSALQTSQVGQGLNWTNPASGHLGTVTAYATSANSAGEPCRNYQQTITIGPKTVFAYDTACRNQKGEWHSIYYASLAEPISHGTTSPERSPYFDRYPYYGYAPYCYGDFSDPFCYPFGGSVFFAEPHHHFHH